MAFPHTKEAALGNIGLTSSQQTTLLHLHACIDTLSCATYYHSTSNSICIASFLEYLLVHTTLISDKTYIY